MTCHNLLQPTSNCQSNLAELSGAVTVATVTYVPPPTMTSDWFSPSFPWEFWPPHAASNSKFLSGIQMPTAESKKSSSGSLSTRRSPPWDPGWLAGWIVCSSAAWSESLEVPSLRFAGNLSGIFKMSTVWKAARFAVCDSSEHVGWMFWVLFQVPLRLQPLSHCCFCSCSLLESSVCSVLSVSPIFWE